MKHHIKFALSTTTLSQLLSLSIILFSLALPGCGGGGAGDVNSSQDTGIPGEQRFTATIVDHNGAPISDSAITIVANSKQAVTDSSGRAEILTDTLLAGDIDVDLQAPWGNIILTLFGVTTESRAVVFNVVLDQTARTAAVNSLRVAPLGALSVTNSPACLTCHTVKGDPDCASQPWLNIHGHFYNCNSGLGGTSSTSSCASCHGERGAPQCGNSTWKSIHASYACNNESGTQNPGSWQCISCHSNKGHVNCEDPKWVSEHGFVSCANGTGNGQFRCNSCHTLKNTPQCGSASWLNDHPFWSCGSNGGTCTSCHGYKGSPKCGDSYWRQTHEFYSCSSTNSESLNCASCHAAKVETKCEDASWKATHHFFGNSKNVGSTSNMCASCHDSDRGEEKCDDPTWRSFHCFCG